ncbi:hypothetical protein RM543_11220 [Roseicyclus sp. F158]|uniref:Lipoprotein n=1 Tax=Tropicimonas omnivorans TaxID=3075590 RepID=A0ABU3DHS1_9RHOB|nr:hypothetical protein [Roseicyclus sp. F158]MDT0683259.1 hypothetical protein [Roseicyclus sp. F158]
MPVRSIFLALALLAGAACAPFPDLDTATSDQARAAPYPDLVALDPIIAEARAARAGTDPGPMTAAEAEALRRRAERLDGPVVDAETKERMAEALDRRDG